MKYIEHIFIAFLSVLMISCAEEMEQNQSVVGGIQEITASFADGQSKTVLGSDGTSVLWSPNDEINVFYNGDDIKFRSINSEPKATTLFVSSGTVLIVFSEDYADQPYLYGVYPYSDDNAQEGELISLSVPSSQTAVEGSFARGSYPSVGRSKNTSIAFYNVCGGMRFTLCQSGIRKIILSGNNNETLAGKVKVQFDENGKPKVSAVIAGEKSITLSAPDSSEFQTGKWYYISVLPTSLDNGFNVDFIKQTDQIERGTKNITSAVQVKRSVFGSVENIDDNVVFKAIADSSKAVELSNAAIVARFNELIASSSFGTGGYQDVSITSDGYTWTGNMNVQKNNSGLTTPYVQIRNKQNACLKTPVFTAPIVKIEFEMTKSTSTPQDRTIYAIPMDATFPTGTTAYGDDLVKNNYGSVDVVNYSGNKYTINMSRDSIYQATIVALGGASYFQSVKVYFNTEPVPPTPKPEGKINPDPVCNWMELPATTDKSLYFFTHPMTISGKRYRNYSYFWDTTALVAHWVAYPMNATLKSGSCGRSEKWGGLEDTTKLSVKYQPYLHTAYKGDGASWARGHQIPSADRQILAYNIETYYGVNMTPQNGSLNSGQWASLEAYVRTRCTAVDTLYVVTGCVVKGSTQVAYDNYSKAVTVPVGYYKALLAYKQDMSIGVTSQTGGYTGIAFYFNNEPYSGKFMDASMTIDALENLTGEDFFVNLPSAVGATKAVKVEASMDSWWTNDL